MASLRVRLKNVDRLQPRVLKISWKVNLIDVPNVNEVVKTMDFLTFEDGYALSLIAQYPNENRSDVTPHLREDARKVAEEMISPGQAQGDVKSAAENLLKLAEKARTARP